MLTASGAWKLAGLGLASRAQFGSDDSSVVKPFDYRNSSTPAWLQFTQVSLLTAHLSKPTFLVRLSYQSKSSRTLPKMPHSRDFEGVQYLDWRYG